MKNKPGSSLIWLTAWRMIRARKGGYLSAVTVISLLGVVIGVASLLVIFSIVSGFEDIFRDKLLGIYPHAIIIGGGADVTTYKEVENSTRRVSGVKDAAAATYDEMMISARGRSEGVIVKGLQAESLLARSLEEKMVDGSLASLARDLTWTWEEGRLNITSPIGGADWTFVRWPNSLPMLLRPCVEEEPDDGAALRLALEPELEGSCLVEGLFDSRQMEFTAQSSHVLLNPGLTTITCGTVSRELNLEVGQISTLVLTREGESHLLNDLPPGRNPVPGRIKVLNLGSDPLTVTLDQSSVPVAPGREQTFNLEEARLPAVVLSIGLAEKLRVKPGDEVSLVSPLQGMSRMFRGPKGSRPVADKFQVSGILEIGYYEYDSKLVLMDFEQALRFLHRGDKARWVEVITGDIFRLDDIIDRIKTSLADFTLPELHHAVAELTRRRTLMELEGPRDGSATSMLQYVYSTFQEMRYGPAEVMSLGLKEDYRVISWREMNRSMFVAMQRQRIVLSLFFMIIIIVAAFNIVGSQSMMVAEKLKEISMLKVLGFTPRDVRRVFTIHGLVIGGLGALAGLASGLGIGFFLDQVGFPLDPVVYYVDKLPISLRYGDMIFVTLAAFLLVYIAVLIAASRAAARTPVEGLTELE